MPMRYATAAIRTFVPHPTPTPRERGVHDVTADYPPMPGVAIYEVWTYGHRRLSCAAIDTAVQALPMNNAAFWSWLDAMERALGIVPPPTSCPVLRLHT